MIPRGIKIILKKSGKQQHLQEVLFDYLSRRKIICDPSIKLEEYDQK